MTMQEKKAILTAICDSIESCQVSVTPTLLEMRLKKFYPAWVVRSGWDYLVRSNQGVVCTGNELVVRKTSADFINDL